MKNETNSRKGIYALRSLSAICLVLLTPVFLLAQNVSDSDLSNSAGTNKNWQNSMWFFGVLIVLVIVVLLAFNRKRNRTRSNLTREDRHQ
jgi:heme/copper-type cytochrome/quinol oxidase subunit 2